MNFKKSYSAKNDGFSLIEMVVYIALLALILTIIINMLVSVIRSQRNIRSSRAVEEALVSSFDRMVREIRDSDSIDAASALGANIASGSGSLKLNSRDAMGNSRTVEFYVENGILKLRENDVDSGPLMPATATVTNLVLYSIDSGHSKAVHIDMTVQSGQGASTRNPSLSTTVILRSTY